VSTSIGGLYLQVKLRTDQAEQQLKRLGRTFAAEVDPSRSANAAAKAQAARVRESVEAMRTQRASEAASARAADAAAKQAAAAARVESEKIKASVAAQKAQVRASDVAVRSANAQTRAETAMATEAARSRRLILNDNLVRQRKADAAAAQAAAKAERTLAKAREDAAKRGSTLRQTSNILGSGSTDLLTGLGAARSGNYFYGLAAGGRYFGNLASAAKGASLAVVGTTAAIAAVGVAAIGVGGALTILSTKLASSGIEAATSFEMLRQQLSGLLGDAARGEEDFRFLLELGKRSIIPTETLIEADRTLAAFGVEVDSVRRSIIETISNVGSSQALSQNQIYFLSLAIGQVVSKGKADAIDLRQIATAGIPTTRLLGVISQQTGKSVDELRNGISEGAITAELLTAGLAAYGKQFEGSAKAAAATIAGLKQNITETFKTNLGTAFLDAGALEPIRRFLLSIQDFLQNNPGLFDNLAASVRNFLDALFGGFSQGEGSDIVVTVLTETIPGAINTAADALRSIVQVAKDVWPAFREAFKAVAGSVRDLLISLKPLAPVLGVTLLGLVGGLVLGMSALSASLSIVHGMLMGVVHALTAFAYAATLNFDAARASMVDAANAVAEGFSRAVTIAGGAVEAFQALGRIASGNSALDWKGETGGGDLSAAQKQAAAQESARARQMAQYADQIAQARDSIFQAMRSAFGQPSALLAGLFGDAGRFTASVDQIVAAADKLRTDVLNANPLGGGEGIVRVIETQTRKLIALAKQRDAVSALLEKAQERLNRIVDDRNALVQQIAANGNAFVNSLNLESVTTTTYKRLDSAGSFMLTTETTTSSFAAQVRKRLAKYRKFVKDIRALQKAGLSKVLIRSFLEAGPDAAADIVAQIAASPQSVIADLNKSQSELAKLNKEFGVEQGGAFYGAGQAAAEQVVAGLMARKRAIELAAKAAADTIMGAVRPLAQQMKVAGADAANGLGAGVAATDLDGVGRKAGDDIKTGFEQTDPSRAGSNFARDLVNSVINGLGNLGNRILGNVRQAAIDGLTFGAEVYQAGVNFAGRIYGTITGWWEENAAPRLGAMFARIGATIPTAQHITGRVREALTGVPGFLARRAIDFTGGARNLWATLTSGIPANAGILDRVRGVFANVPAVLSNVRGNLIESVGGFWSFLLDLPGVRQLREALQPLATAFKGVVNGLIAMWNRIDFTIDISFPSSPFLGPLSGARIYVPDVFPDVTPFAAGGIVTKPTLGMVGEGRVPELVAPLNRQGLAPFADLLRTVGGGGASLPPTVKVYIGDRELTDLIDVRIEYADDAAARRVVAGRR
jgi:tape measure domain-containing protein